ncbi:cleft lip and palate transmembrane protein 1-domain-containing protein [Catenaria anguillulae PL171]|uniref:Cleft lip and palate transmembrane protein 1-domain-containing protein n=1 Tax=Catenaria anguillulae PL171 TaxID=765915 RepID=A0A1Y2I5S8_9FUNG|nr:cleft lip and palate transmembrane protein 1-domain-containing protein [Catenaria anguillulae PL171]
MPDAAPAAAQAGGGSSFFSNALRVVLWAYVGASVLKMFTGGNKAAPQPPAQAVDADGNPLPPSEVPAAAPGTGVAQPTQAADGGALSGILESLTRKAKYQSPHPHYNLWRVDQALDFYVYLSTQSNFTPSASDEPFFKATNSIVPRQRRGYSPVALTQYRPKRRAQKQAKKLLSAGETDAGKGQEQQEEEDVSIVDVITGKAKREIVNYWSGNLTVNVVPTEGQIVPDRTPPFVTDWIDWLPEHELFNREGELVGFGHKAPVWINDFWILDEDLLLINSTTTVVPLHIKYYPAKLMTAGADVGGSGLDEIKRMLRDTNPWYLALTMLVSVLHSLFEFLAFKNDIAHWKKRKSVKGISVRSMLINLGIQVIVFLYLLDNSTNTSMVILLSNGVGLAIEFWKVTRATKFHIDYTNRMYGIVPRISLGDKKSYTKSRTKEFDDEAFKYMQYLMYPLLAAYAVYSLVYNEHKSWYSFVLNTLVGAVYTFGFLQSLPQLFINYRLKSVAHMNGRTMTYKFLTTIVDDLFAFAVKMPTLQRIAVFRDDVVFVIFLIQRYLYRVDHTRVNEYGQGGDGAQQTDEEEDEDERESSDEREADKKGKDGEEKQAPQPTLKEKKVQ